MHIGIALLGLLAACAGALADGALPLFALPAEPEIAATGDAAAALSTGAAAVALNPAGMSAGERPEVALSMAFLYQDIRRSTGAVASALPVPGMSPRTLWVGLSISTVSYGSMERRSGPSAAPQGEYGADDTRVGIALAGSPLDGLHLGAGVSRSEARIADVIGAATALDAGMIYSLASPALDFGISGINLITLSTGDRLGDLARMLQGSVRWTAWSGRLALTSGLRVLDDDDPEIVTGGEYAVIDQLLLRVGRVFGHDTAGYTAGLGAEVGDLRLAYSFETHGLGLGSSHRVGLTWRL